VCAVTASLLGPVLADPDTRALYVACVEELAALGRKQGVALPQSAVADTLAFSDRLPPQTRPSMLLSLEQGQRLEVDILNGTAARLGRELGVPTPVNGFIYAALKLRAGGRAG
jgi:2-dehydropantoate 2-reductase